MYQSTECPSEGSRCVSYPRSHSIHPADGEWNEFGWIATGEGAVWTTDNFQGILWRVDPSRGSAVRSIQVGSGALGVGVGAGSVWVANSTAGTVSRVDPLENAIASTIELGGIPRGVAVGEGAVWVTVG